MSEPTLLIYPEMRGDKFLLWKSFIRGENYRTNNFWDNEEERVKKYISKYFPSAKFQISYMPVDKDKTVVDHFYITLDDEAERAQFILLTTSGIEV